MSSTLSHPLKDAIHPASERVLILGTDPLAEKIAELISAFPDRYGIVGFVDDAFNTGGILPRNGAAIFRNGDSIPHVLPQIGTAAAESGSASGDEPNHGAAHSVPTAPFAIVGPLDRLDNAIKDLHPDRIIVPFSEGVHLPLQALLNSRIDGVDVDDANELYERLTRKLPIESLPPSLLIFCKNLKMPWAKMALRRALSLVFAGIGLLLAVPVIPLIAIAIKLDSKGPVLFIQERIGLHGRPFRLYKFRTMHPTDEKTSEWVRDNHARVTRIGRWLRRFRLDELPQLFNVFRGDMDAVGPRPHPVSHMELFSKTIPYYSFRSVVRPGITGWAQIRYGYANSIDEEIEKMRYDLYYIKNISILFDLQILFRTLQIVVFGRGSTGIEPVQR